MESVVMVCRPWIAGASWVTRIAWVAWMSRIPRMSVMAAVWAVVTVVAWTVMTVVVRSVVMLVVRTVVTVVSWLSLRIAVGTASSAGVSGGCSSAVAGVLGYHIGCRHR